MIIIYFQHVAIIIPYRNRLPQLQVMVPRLHTVLQTQKLNYTIFVAEQVMVFIVIFMYMCMGMVLSPF